MCSLYCRSFVYYSLTSHCYAADLQIAFSTFDRDGDGVITSRELRQVLVHLGFEADSREVEKMIRKVDLDGKHVRAALCRTAGGGICLVSARALSFTPCTCTCSYYYCDAQAYKMLNKFTMYMYEYVAHLYACVYTIRCLSVFNINMHNTSFSSNFVCATTQLFLQKGRQCSHSC